jgi:hypothetical protein
MSERVGGGWGPHCSKVQQVTTSPIRGGAQETGDYHVTISSLAIPLARLASVLQDVEGKEPTQKQADDQRPHRVLGYNGADQSQQHTEAQDGSPNCARDTTG